MKYFLEQISANYIGYAKSLNKLTTLNYSPHVSNAQRVCLGLNEVLIDSKYTKEPQTITKLMEKLQIGENHRDN